MARVKSQGTILSAHDLSTGSGDVNTNGIATRFGRNGSIVASWASVTSGGTPSVAAKLQGSHDESNWVDISGKTFSVADLSTDASAGIELSDGEVNYPFYRLVWDGTAITGGTLNVSYYFLTLSEED